MMTSKRVGEAVSIVASPKQEALIVRDRDKVQVTLRTHFRAGPEDLAWVVPVPEKPETVEKAEDGLFGKLQEVTTPHFYSLQRRPGGLGCGCPGPSQSVTGSLSALETGTAGLFDYTVLQAGGVEVLIQWLEQHGYVIPSGAQTVFQHYVDGGWYWLAIRLRPEKSEEATLAPHPIRYTYRADRLVYPLVISRLSADQQNEILLYVLASSQFGCENWTSFAVSDESLILDRTSPSGTNYEKLLQETIQREGGHGFVTEFAHDLDTAGVGFRPLLQAITGEDRKLHAEMTLFYLTRLRTVIPPEAMDRDVILIPKQVGKYDWISNSHTIQVRSNEAGSNEAISSIAVLAGGLLLLFGFRRIRRTPRGPGAVAAK